MKPKVLLIEDSQRWGDEIVSKLGERCDVTWLKTGTDALELVEKCPYHIVIVDCGITPVVPYLVDFISKLHLIFTGMLIVGTHTGELQCSRESLISAGVANIFLKEEVAEKTKSLLASEVSS